MKYNLLIVTPDQMRADYLGCYGKKDARTEHIDRLAAQGATFDNCYCASPLCGPSRISFATSTYVGEHNHRNYWSTISPDVPNLVSSLKRAGYRTGMFGKNHLFTYGRLREVWDELDEICLGNYDGHPDYSHSYSAFTLAKDHPFNITARLTDEAVDFMAASEVPFVAWVNYQDPHPAYTCPPPYDGMFDPAAVELPKTWEVPDREGKPIRNEVWRAHSEMDGCGEAEIRRAIAYYQGQIKYVDDSLGRLLDALERSGRAADTVVLFFSDHGELMGDYRMTHKIPVFYDCLARIPAIVRHPDGRWAGARFSGLTEEVDLAPTLLAMLGIDIPPTMVGTPWAEALDRGDYAGKPNVLCEAGGGAPTCGAPIPGLALTAPHLPTSLGPGAMLREGRYKLSMYFDDRCELYDLQEDPHETLNLYERGDYAAVRNDMTSKLLKRLLGVKVRDVGIDWPDAERWHDVRFEPLEIEAQAQDTHGRLSE